MVYIFVLGVLCGAIIFPDAGGKDVVWVIMAFSALMGFFFALVNGFKRSFPLFLGLIVGGMGMIVLTGAYAFALFSTGIDWHGTLMLVRKVLIGPAGFFLGMLSGSILFKIEKREMDCV